MNVIIVDPKCPYPYDDITLTHRGMGGTESTVVRVAEGLAARGVDVCVAQHNRRDAHTSANGVRYVHSSAALEYCHSDTSVVFVQKAQGVREISKRAGGKLWIWLHNFAVDEVPLNYPDHLMHRLGIICVSGTHARHTVDQIRASRLHRMTFGLLPRIDVRYVYNPLNPNLPAPAAEIDPNKLVFFSSPYKGIDHVLASFGRLYEKNPALRLYVANPGYVVNFDESKLHHPGIVVLGALAHKELHEHVRNAFCVFYPQRKRPETFGLVYAEANAVGTPVLAHDFGAAQEVLCDNNQPEDCSDFTTIEARLQKWQKNGRPIVSARPEFDLQAVLNDWEALLGIPTQDIAHRRDTLRTG